MKTIACSTWLKKFKLYCMVAEGGATSQLLHMKLSKELNTLVSKLEASQIGVERVKLTKNLAEKSN